MNKKKLFGLLTSAAMLLNGAPLSVLAEEMPEASGVVGAVTNDDGTVALNKDNFPDSDLLNAILDQNEGTTDAAKVEKLNVPNTVEDLSGLQYLTGLTTFILQGNNNIETVDLSKNTNLTTIIIGGADLEKTGEAAPVTTNWALYSVILPKTETLTDVTISNNPSLTTLDLSPASVLTTANVSNNALAQLDLSTNTHLTSLIVDGNKLYSLDTTNSPKLETLSAAGNKIYELKVSPNALEDLNLAGNKLRSLDASKMTKLNSLNIGDNMLETVSLPQESNIATFIASYNHLASLNLSKVVTSNPTTVDVSNQSLYANVDDTAIDLEAYDPDFQYSKATVNGVPMTDGVLNLPEKPSTSTDEEDNKTNLAEATAVTLTITKETKDAEDNGESDSSEDNNDEKPTTSEEEQPEETNSAEILKEAEEKDNSDDSNTEDNDSETTAAPYSISVETEDGTEEATYATYEELAAAFTIKNGDTAIDTQEALDALQDGDTVSITATNDNEKFTGTFEEATVVVKDGEEKPSEEPIELSDTNTVVIYEGEDESYTISQMWVKNADDEWIEVENPNDSFKIGTPDNGKVNLEYNSDSASEEIKNQYTVAEGGTEVKVPEVTLSKTNTTVTYDAGDSYKITKVEVAIEDGPTVTLPIAAFKWDENAPEDEAGLASAKIAYSSDESATEALKAQFDLDTPAILNYVSSAEEEVALIGLNESSSTLIPAAEYEYNTGTAKGSMDVTIYKESLMNRLYNPNSGEHFYTKDTNEKNVLVSLGWQFEGIGWVAPKAGEATTPVYRLYNANAGDHHYTKDANEKDTLVKIGWSFEGVGWYSATDPTPYNAQQGTGNRTIEVFREYNPNAKEAGAHNYTISENENAVLVSIGWIDEGIAWNALK